MMDIIPAIDIKNGKVVKALKGNREHYQAISSGRGFTSNPFTYIKKMIDKYHPRIIYIADINTLSKDGDNIDLLVEIVNQNKNCVFWIDIGGKFDRRLNKNNIVPILCSENCSTIKNINYIFRNYIHSYDYKDKPLGIEVFQRLQSSYKKKVIFMNISDVGGNHGPNYKYIRTIHKKSSIKYYIGGGVKSVLDINKLQKMGFSGVLVSSILFKNYTSTYLIKKRAGNKPALSLE
jgi:phosphoribosylformimino-5-aminoimidazole carboxamide ribotide isomerase